MKAYFVFLVFEVLLFVAYIVVLIQNTIIRVLGKKNVS